jgi:glucuronate isomerase
MRANGIDEDHITGSASDHDKFLAWARTVPRTIGNPLYHWTHLELQRYFGIDETLNEGSAESIWNRCNEVIAGRDFAVSNLLAKFRVRALCTTDDPADDLAFHASYAASGKGKCVMVPAFRPDKAMTVEDPSAWKAYIRKLETASGVTITRYADLVSALDKRHLAFHEAGSRLSDHGIEKPFAVLLPESALDAAMERLFRGETVGETEAAGIKTAVMLDVGRMNAKRGWTMQLHMGAIRNLSSRMVASFGPDTGFDAIGDDHMAKPLALFLDTLDREGSLPKTILYDINPASNEVLGTVMGCFQDGSVPGKLQFGSAWWFNDNATGMRDQLTSLANLGLLGRFVGMLTESRSFLSFPRHEYFRRVLCDLVGGWVERGEVPADFELLGSMVRDISYRNAAGYFGIPGGGKE